MKSHKADFTVQNEGNIFLVHANHSDARAFLDEVSPAEAQFFGRALVVDHGCIAQFVGNLQGEGFSVQ